MKSKFVGDEDEAKATIRYLEFQQHINQHLLASQKPSPIKITQFFTDALGANLRNQQWSWGAYDPISNRVYLRVWLDEIGLSKDGERVLVAWIKPRHKSNGFTERFTHLNLIENGATGFGVVCRAANPKTSDRRKIAGFDNTVLLKLDNTIKDGKAIFGRIAGRVPVAEVARQQTSQSTLTEDLKSIVKLKIEATTKEALVNARVGQGKFRTQLLKLWENCCAVTGAKTQDAIRASHIKPWRESTNEERLDPSNGIPMVATLDALFDAGLISFESSGRMIVSSRLNSKERRIFGVDDGSLYKRPTTKTAAYLAYHRDNCLQK